MRSKIDYIESMLTKTACEIAYARKRYQERPSTYHEMRLASAVREYQKVNDAYDREVRNATR